MRVIRQTFPPFAAVCLLASALHGQTSPDPAPPPKAPTKEPANSLGMPFKEIRPGLEMARWETRLSDFKTFLTETGYQWPGAVTYPQEPDHPVAGVNRNDAIAFCDWLTRFEQNSGLIKPTQLYRLPTHEEWDLGVGLQRDFSAAGSVEARIRESNTYPWGSAWPPPANAANLADGDIPDYQDGFEHTSPVGRFTPNESGLHDMAGNVWEWVSDDKGTSGFLRGGSWMYFNRDCLLAAYRYEVPKELRASTFGFRLVRVTDAANNLAANTTPAIPAPQTTPPSAIPNIPESTPEEMAAARARLIGGERSPDAKAEPGLPFINALLMEFRPSPANRNLLIATTETKFSDFQTYATEKGVPMPKPEFAQEPDHPVVQVSATEAEAFCVWLTEKDRAEGRLSPSAQYRLPTDAEWDAIVGLEGDPTASPADRSVSADPNRFPWGSAWPPPLLSGNLGAVEGSEPDRHPFTAPVASYRSGLNGFFDVSGNAAEWTSSPWKNGAPERAIRGSSWSSSRRETIISGYRDYLDPNKKRDDLGFRCVLELTPPKP